MNKKGRYVPSYLSLDPSAVKVEQRIMTVGYLIKLLEENRVDLYPDIQRSGNLWDRGKQSRLIESILLGLPLPSFYFDFSTYNGSYVPVDGLQRLYALRNFAVTGKLTLHGLDFLTDYENKRWEDFSFYDRRRFLNAEVACNIIGGNASTDVKFVIFSRLNVEGVPLNSQEIRNALFPDVSERVLRHMAELGEFKRLGISSRRMTDMELVLRFLAFYINDFRDYSGRMDFFLNETMERLRRFDDIEVDRLIALFSESLRIADFLFGIDAFRPYSSTERRKPLSKTLFETLTVTIARNIDVNFMSRADKLRNRYRQLLMNPYFQETLSTDTAGRNKVVTRFEMMQRLFNSL
ncbi:MAG: DUF262 domain-containing protein [Paramuribaculum sp.]|nr:DUF262 domain-containing protein [Paramuribaculum sp.]MDE6303686.1 DUF262 domain-containing protein [Paramuribaculum sp.]